MSDVISALSTLCATNPYLPKKTWLRDLQNAQLNEFLQRGFPTHREEQWKYTDTSALAKQAIGWAHPESGQTKINLPPHFALQIGIRLVFVNGYFTPHLSNLAELPSTVLLKSLAQAFLQHENLLAAQVLTFDAKLYPFASLNTALMSDGMFLSVPNNTSLKTPIHCIYLSTHQQHFMTCPRNIILAGENSDVTIVEEYIGTDAQHYLTNAVTLIQAEAGARIQHYKIQAEQTQSTHISNTFVTQAQDSVFTSFNLAVGSHLARDNLRVALQEKGAECHLNGFYKLTQDGQHIDTQLHVDHIAELGTSTMLFKGILDNKSRGVFNGKVLVHPGAQKIDAQQANHNLLLSPYAEINTKPELEIYADDVKCVHGATVGQLDSEALFYLQSRGIDKDAALALLTHAFAADVFNKVAPLPIRHYLELLGGQHAQ